MGKQWATVSTADYADGNPSDDGSATEANRVKYATIMTDLTDPLDTGLTAVIANLDELFDTATTPTATNYTTVVSDHCKILEVTSSKTISLLDAASGGAGYKVGVYASGADATVSRTSTDTINGATSLKVPEGGILWFTVNGAGDGYVADAAGATMTDTVSLSGTAVNFAVPSWAKHARLTWAGMSIDGATDDILVRLGTGSTDETTGYLSSSANHPGTIVENNTTAFNLTPATAGAANVWHGAIEITLVQKSSNTWIATFTHAASNTTAVYHGAGTKGLAGVLDQISLVTESGTDSFNAGVAAVTYW